MNKWILLLLLLLSFNVFSKENSESWHKFLNEDKNTSYNVRSLKELEKLVPENGKKASYKKGVIDITTKMIPFENESLPKGNIGINRAGYVIIQDHNFDNLSFLGSLNYVYYLAISYLPELKKLEGLNNLKEVGNLNIRNVSKLEDLNGLSNLETIYETLIIDDVDLRDLNFLSNLKKLGDKEKGIIGKIKIKPSPNLVDLSGIENLSNIMEGSSIELPFVTEEKIEVFLNEKSPLCREIKKKHFYISINNKNGSYFCRKPRIKEI